MTMAARRRRRTRASPRRYRGIDLGRAIGGREQFPSARGCRFGELTRQPSAAVLARSAILGRCSAFQGSSTCATWSYLVNESQSSRVPR